MRCTFAVISAISLSSVAEGCGVGVCMSILRYPLSVKGAPPCQLPGPSGGSKGRPRGVQAQAEPPHSSCAGPSVGSCLVPPVHLCPPDPSSGEGGGHSEAPSTQRHCTGAQECPSSHVAATVPPSHPPSGAARMLLLHCAPRRQGQQAAAAPPLKAGDTPH